MVTIRLRAVWPTDRASFWFWAMMPGAGVDGVDVVGEEGVAGILRDDAERHQDGQAPAVAAGLEEVDVAGGVLDVLLGVDGLADLAELELDRGVVLVATGVVAGQGVERLVGAVLGHQPAGRLGDPVDEGQLYERGHDLDERDGPP